ATAHDLGAQINAGRHVFAVLPRSELGGDQYLVAGLIQSTMIDAVFRRTPDDPANPTTEAYLDEAAVYATSTGLGTLLAEARKFNVSCTVSLQGFHQAEAALQDELRTNTAIKAFFGTDHTDEARRAAATLAVGVTAPPLGTRNGKAKGKERAGDRKEAVAGQVVQLKPRHYLLKVRGVPEHLEVRTATYHAQHLLPAAIRIATTERIAALVSADQADAEIAWRAQWLDARSYLPQLHPAAVVSESHALQLPEEERWMDDDDVL
ncbi:MAG: type IV secretory system conjugative DNA transfer family protein, partial [Chloroflexota bacterium]|nr:type IV secretory system conjugative DNA transfer family protein [Chloroflexota bacterium]